MNNSLRIRILAVLMGVSIFLSGCARYSSKEGHVYEVSKRDLLDEDYRSLDGTWTPFTELSIVLIYNHKLVKESDAPRGWEDLLRDRWRGGAFLIQMFKVKLGRDYRKRDLEQAEVIDETQLSMALCQLVWSRR